MILRIAIFQTEHCIARSVKPLFPAVPLVAQNYNTNRNLKVINMRILRIHSPLFPLFPRQSACSQNGGFRIVQLGNSYFGFSFINKTDIFINRLF